MRIILKGVSKRFDRDWIIRNFSYDFESGHCYGIQGRNGSGKSTLIRMIASHLSPSRGQIKHSWRGKDIATSAVYPYLSYVAPYIDVIEELTLAELLQFHFKFKEIHPAFSLAELPQVLGLNHVQQRRIQAYSSGMKQRVNLGLALCSNTPLLILDEPTTTLDKEGQNWFQQLLAQTIQLEDRTTIIASNVEADMQQCEAYIRVGTS